VARKGSSWKRGSVAIGTVPTPDRVLGMKVKRGRVSKVRNKYFLTVGGRKTEIPVGSFILRSEIGKMTNKSVYVAFSNTRKSEIVAIGTWPTPEKPRVVCYIICYIPADDMVRRIGPDVRDNLIDKMVNENIITPELAREIEFGPSFKMRR